MDVSPFKGKEKRMVCLKRRGIHPLMAIALSVALVVSLAPTYGLAETG